MTKKDLIELIDHIEETSDIFFVTEEQQPDGSFKLKDVYVSSEVGHEPDAGHIIILKPVQRRLDLDA